MLIFKSEKMMRKIIPSFIILLLATTTLCLIIWFNIEKEPGALIPKFSWQGKKKVGNELIELKRTVQGLSIPSFWPRSLAIRRNCLYAADYWNHHLQILKINSDGSLTPQFIFGKKGESLGEFNKPQKLIIKGNYLYVAETGNHRIQILKIKSDGSLTPKFIFGKRGEGLVEFFSGPNDLIIREDYLYVAETGNGHILILKINSDGSLSPRFIFGKKGESLKDFNPGKLGIEKNYLYAADDHNNLIHILKINSNGSLSPKFIFGKRGKWGRGLGEFSSGPDNLIIKVSHLYVTDVDNHHIQIFKINPDGSLTPKFIFGKKGKSLGEFDIPGKLIIKGSYLYVADTGNHHIQVLKINPDGSLTPKFIFGKKGEGLGKFFIPNDLLIKENYLYVSDAGNDRIQTLEIKYQ